MSDIEKAAAEAAAEGARLAAEQDPPDGDPPAGDPPPPKPGAEQRIAQRQTREREELEKLRAEIKTYRSAAEQSRIEKLSEEERRQEEYDRLRRDNERLALESNRFRVGAKLGLPDAIAELLQGSDFDAMLAHGEALKALLPARRAGTVTEPGRDGQQPPKRFSRRDLAASPELARSPEVRQAAAEGRIDP